MNFAQCERCRRIASVNRARKWSPLGTVEVRSPSPPGASVRGWTRVCRPRRVKVNRHPRHTRQLCPIPRGPPLGAVGLQQRHAKTDAPRDGETELRRKPFDGISDQGRARRSSSASSRGGCAMCRAPDGSGTRLSEAMCFILQRSCVHPGASGNRCVDSSLRPRPGARQRRGARRRKARETRGGVDEGGRRLPCHPSSDGHPMRRSPPPRRTAIPTATPGRDTRQMVRANIVYVIS
jgi:hypothetical protein